MKITDFSIVFVLLFFPVFLVIGYHIQDQRHVHFTELKYAAALRTAVQDAGSVLNVNERQEWEAGYGSEKFFKADKELALATFYRSLYINLGIGEDPVAQQALDDYIPAVIVIDYDGYSVYAGEEYADTKGQTMYKHLWKPKKPYSYSDQAGNLVRFTLDNYIEAYEASSGRWYKGLQKEIADITAIPLLQSSSLFEQVRRAAIVHMIEDDLANIINRNNESSARNGVSYLFTLPLISQEEWNNTINDIGIMAFIQGLPVGDRALNNYALGGGRLVKAPLIQAGIDRVTGIPYFTRNGCSSSLEHAEIFSSPKDAAAQGYFERSCDE